MAPCPPVGSRRSRPISVMHVTDGSRWGGIEAHLLNLHRAARATREWLELTFAFTDDSDPLRRFRQEGAEVFPLRGTWGGKVLSLRRQLRLRQIDLLHVHGYLGAVIGVLAGLGMRLPIIATLHGGLEKEDNWTTRTRWYSQIAKYLLLHARARFIAVSEVTALQWQENRVPRIRMRVVHNGIAVANGTRPDPAARCCGPLDGRVFRIGIVGRLVPVKDHAMFLEVGVEVLQQRRDVQLVVIGDGPLREELEARSQRLGIGSSVEFAGFRSDVSEYLGGLDLLVFTSRSEGVPYALLEAMAQGVPTVAPRVGGLPEVLCDGENALLAYNRTARELAEAVLRVLDDGQLRQRLSEGAQSRISRGFSGEVMLRDTLAVYEEQLAEYRQACSPARDDRMDG